MDRISLYWRNATADVVGEKHGVSGKDLKQLAGSVKSLTKQMAEERKAGRLKYRDLPYDEEMVDSIHREVEHFRDRCEVLIVLGIGGSALGNKALHEALNPSTYNLMSDRTRPGPQMFVLDNLDPDQLKAVLELVTPKIKKTVINVIGDSGETVQTAAQFILFRDLLQQKLGKKYPENILATTPATGGTLRKIALAEGFRTLEAPEGVDARFSVMSAMGLFSAALSGIDVDAVLEGARDMDERVKSGDLFANPAAMIAALHFSLGQKGKNIAVMMPYSSSLAAAGDWFGQLWAQSLGKKDGIKQKNLYAGQTPLRAVGATDQHSFLQLFCEGPHDKLVTFVEVERFGQKVAIPQAYKQISGLEHLSGGTFAGLINAERAATEQLLAERQRPTATVVLPNISSQTVGQFLYLYQAAVSYMGGLLAVNPYDQPAVEIGRPAFGPTGRDEAVEVSARIQAGSKRDRKYLM